jgi:hypothetical protein
MATQIRNDLFNPNGCLTAHAIRSYLDGSLRITGKREVEKHLRHCQICAEAVEGFKGHQRPDILKSDIEFLSGRIRKRYTSTRRINQRLPIMIAFSIFVSLIILMIIFYIIRQYMTNL